MGNVKLETLCKLYLELANVVPDDCVSVREFRLRSLLREANELLRSAHAIATRELVLNVAVGEDARRYREKTNWLAFQEQLRIAIEKQRGEF